MPEGHSNANIWLDILVWSSRVQSLRCSIRLETLQDIRSHENTRSRTCNDRISRVKGKKKSWESS